MSKVDKENKEIIIDFVSDILDQKEYFIENEKVKIKYFNKRANEIKYIEINHNIIFISKQYNCHCSITKKSNKTIAFCIKVGDFYYFTCIDNEHLILFSDRKSKTKSKNTIIKNIRKNKYE